MPGANGDVLLDGKDVGFINGYWPTCAAWLAFTVVAFGTTRNVYRHLVNYSRPDLQQHVLRIILVAPLYAFSAALCLSLEQSACIFVNAVRDIWEAVVIYSFLTLVIEYMGGEHLCLHSISQCEEGVHHLFPLNFCLPPIPTGSMIRVPKIGALQFVVIKPLLAAVSIVVYACGEYNNSYYQWTLFIIYNISYSVALYALYLIYWASHEQKALQSRRPLLKFLSVKMIVFLTFWQALLLPHAPLPGSIGRWEDLILSFEMVVFSILMNTAFSWKEFHSGLRASELSSRVGKAGDLIDLEGTGRACRQPRDRGKIVQNARAAFCPRDIMLDASANFSRRYQQHVLIESAQEYELRSSDMLGDLEQNPDANARPVGPKASGSISSLKTFRGRTYLIGRSLFAGGESPAAAASCQDGDCKNDKGVSSHCNAAAPTVVGNAPTLQADLNSWTNPTDDWRGSDMRVSGPVPGLGDVFAACGAATCEGACTTAPESGAARTASGARDLQLDAVACAVTEARNPFT